MLELTRSLANNGSKKQNFERKTQRRTTPSMNASQGSFKRVPPVTSGGWTNNEPASVAAVMAVTKRPEAANSTAGQLTGAIGGILFHPDANGPYGSLGFMRTAVSADVTLRPEGLKKGTTEAAMAQRLAFDSLIADVIAGHAACVKGFSFPLLFSLQQRQAHTCGSPCIR